MFRSDIKEKTVHPAFAVAGIAFHGSMLFLMPFLVGGVASMFLEVSQVSDTVAQLGTIAMAIIAPIFIAQTVGVLLRTWRESKFLKKQGILNARTLLDSAYRNTKILTGRGYLVLFTGVIFVLASLGFKFASLGVVSVATLVLFYVVSGASVFMSSFLVRSFDSHAGQKQTGIRREYQPAVARTGDSVTEHFHLTRVPVIPGFFLAIQDELPPRLRTEVRHVVPPKARSTAATVSSLVRATPRGVYESGPARIWYADLLGLTQVNVASLATAQLKVMPRLSKVEIIDPPRTPLEEPDILTKPDRFPTEDYFRFREYHAGDDTRRLHWKVSMRVGQLQVRMPETREINAKKVLLALDTWVPPEWLEHTPVIDDLMDGLVDVWVSMAQQLINEGEKVSLVAWLPNEKGELHRELVPCDKGNRPSWLDAGARARWQSGQEVFSLFTGDHAGDHDDLDYMVILTSRLKPIPALTLPGKTTTWIYLHPGDTIGPHPPSLYDLWLNWRDEPSVSGFAAFMRWVQLPHPAGSDENGLFRRLDHYRKRKKLRDHRAFIRNNVIQNGESTFQTLMGRGDTVYRMQVLPDHYRLVGITNGGASAPRDVPEPPSPGRWEKQGPERPDPRPPASGAEPHRYGAPGAPTGPVWGRGGN